jgi:hypothetical protein
MKIAIIETQRRRFVQMAAILLATYTGLFVYTVYDGLNGITLNVFMRDAKISTNNTRLLGNGNSITVGGLGVLEWKPRSVTESMLLTTINNKDADILDLAGFVLMAGMIYFMFKDSRDGAVFTKAMAKGFMMVIVAIGLTGMMADLVRMELARNYIPYITNGQFSGVYNVKILSYNYMIYGLLLFLMRIPRSGLQLQKEAELTI